MVIVNLVKLDEKWVNQVDSKGSKVQSKTILRSKQRKMSLLFKNFLKTNKFNLVEQDNWIWPSVQDNTSKEPNPLVLIQDKFIVCQWLLVQQFQTKEVTTAVNSTIISTWEKVISPRLSFKSSQWRNKIYNMKIWITFKITNKEIIK